EEAFEPIGAAAQRGLNSLLTQWWLAEAQEGQAAIDDAHARAAMRVHIAEIEASEIIGRSVHPAGANRPRGSLLPSDLVAAFDGLRDDSLQSLFVALASSLESASSPPDLQLSERAVRITAASPAPTPARQPAVVGGDSFRQFWAPEAGPTELPVELHRTSWFPTRIVVQMIAAMVAIALVMALMG
ncbi:MAG TPA: hypothetical protein VGM78_07565, partial [Ilumatobacteraceae bacterium]